MKTICVCGYSKLADLVKSVNRSASSERINFTYAPTMDIIEKNLVFETDDIIVCDKVLKR